MKKYLFRFILLLLVANFAFAAEPDEAQPEESPRFRAGVGISAWDRTFSGTGSIGVRVFDHFYVILGVGSQSYSTIDAYVPTARTDIDITAQSTSLLLRYDLQPF